MKITSAHMCNKMYYVPTKTRQYTKKQFAKEKTKGCTHNKNNQLVYKQNKYVYKTKYNIHTKTPPSVYTKNVVYITQYKKNDNQ